MKIRELEIFNFRGIHELSWKRIGDMVCLIGPGDSTKSTILLALEYLFSGNWNLPISDVDFHNMDVQSNIEICAVITNLPEIFLSEDKFGLFLGFWNESNGFHIEQENENDCPALKMQLTIHSNHEPEWTIISPQDDGRDPLKINSSDRRLIGVAHIGAYTESDLSWGRFSALSHLSNKEDLSQIPAMLAQAERDVLEELRDMDFSSLEKSIKEIIPNAQSLGIDAKVEFRAGMNPIRINISQGAISLFDGDLPLSIRGGGCRKLIVMAIHKAAVKEGAIIISDEIENSLEPYRLRHLIRQLRPCQSDNHQLIFTTHSSVAVVECNSGELYITKSEDGTTSIINLDSTLQPIVRSIPEAFLCKKIIVCEGKTEYGLLICLDKDYWQVKHQAENSVFKYSTMAESGTSPIASPRSGGSEAPKYAILLAKLHYKVAYFGDSDTELNPGIEEMIESGVEEIFLWEGNIEIERRLCLDFPIEGLKEFLLLAIELSNDDDEIWTEINDYFSKIKNDLSLKSFEDLYANFDDKIIRIGIGELADKFAWFKRIDRGMALGTLVGKYLDDIDNTPTKTNLERIEKWCYG